MAAAAGGAPALGAFSDVGWALSYGLRCLEDFVDRPAGLEDAHLHGGLGDAEYLGDFALIHAADRCQMENFALSGGEGVDRGLDLKEVGRVQLGRLGDHRIAEAVLFKCARILLLRDADRGAHQLVKLSSLDLEHPTVEALAVEIVLG
jgi:hypothetical protein